MAEIKGKFVATVEIDVCVTEGEPDLLPFEEIKRVINDDLEVGLKYLIQDGFGECATATVTKTFSDVYRAED